MESNCAICENPIFKPSKLAGCRHMFCLGCYKLWLAEKPSCPTCRENGDTLIKGSYTNEEIQCVFCDERINHRDIERHERRLRHRRCRNCIQPMDQGEDKFCSVACRLSVHLMPYTRALSTNNFVKNFIENPNISENDILQFSKRIGNHIYKIYDRLNSRLNFNNGNYASTSIVDIITKSYLSQIRKILALNSMNNYQLSYQKPNRDYLFIFIAYNNVAEDRTLRN